MGIFLLLKLKMSDDEQFDQADAGAMTFPTSAGDIRKGSHMLIKGFPCKIAEVTTSKTGKHGHAKASITGIIFSPERSTKIQSQLPIMLIVQMSLRLSTPLFQSMMDTSLLWMMPVRR